MKLKFGLLEIRKILTFSLLALITFNLPAAVAAQTAPEPRREQILNGLKVLIWSDAKAPKTTVKLRLHAGSAFDPAGKPGVMRLLADSLFPDEATREFVEEDLGGSLKVESNYDYIEIAVTGRNEEFERILDLVRNAVIAPPLTPENFKKVRDTRLKQVQDEAKNSLVFADLAARKRLFGDFPYGRATNGTPESLAKIDYPDLLFARDRFLTADNATLAIVGNVKESFALRAIRQFFGSWRKADKPVISTFKQPDAPESKILIVDAPNASTAEVRFIVRGLARNDRDMIALSLWTKILEKQLQNDLPANLRESLQVENFAHVLPGELLIRCTVPENEVGRAFDTIRTSLAKAITQKVDAKQFAEIQSNTLRILQNELTKPENVADYWLNIDTYKMPSISERLNLVKSAAPTDADRVVGKLFKNSAAAIVIIGNAEQIQPQVDALGQKK